MIAMPIAAALLMLQTAAAPKTAAPKPATPKSAAAATVAKTDVAVTVAYKGKGAVDAGHKILVFAFSDPNITSGSRPIGPAKYVAKNGDTVTFESVTTPIYVFAVYDEKGNYDGLSGPPPPGTPAATYRKTPKGAPTAVAAGSPAVKLTFDDTERWSK